MPRPFFAFVRHPAAIAELPTYMSDYKLLFHDASEEYEFAHTLERPDLYCDSQTVLPGGSDISSGEGFEKNAV